MPNTEKTRAIILRWPSRKEMAADVRKAVIVVHRWYQRGRIPGEYDCDLIAGATRRGFALTAQELVEARSNKSKTVEPAE